MNDWSLWPRFLLQFPSKYGLCVFDIEWTRLETLWSNKSFLKWHRLLYFTIVQYGTSEPCGLNSSHSCYPIELRLSIHFVTAILGGLCQTVMLTFFLLDYTTDCKTINHTCIFYRLRAPTSTRHVRPLTSTIVKPWPSVQDHSRQEHTLRNISINSLIVSWSTLQSIYYYVL